jgi:septum formation protein
MNNESPLPSLILASSSKYRAKLLKRIGIPFTCISPSIDESPLKGEQPAALVGRLAAEKAASIATDYPDAVVIGSDQVATFDGRILGKPGDHDTALDQLTSFSGRGVTFLTAVTVRRAAHDFEAHHTDRTEVVFRTLQRTEIERYLREEAPYDAAGSFKSEGLGITLFERITNDDPTALIGLPLIRTSALLRRAGIRLP